MHTRFSRIALVLLPSLMFAASASRKMAPELSDLPPQSQVDVIIQFTGTPDANLQQKLTGGTGMLKSKLPLLRSASYSLGSNTLDSIASDSQVVYISPDRRVSSALDYAVPTVGGQIATQYGFNGAGIGIAVIDSGITSSPDLNIPGTNNSRIVYSENFVDQSGTTRDQFGHGTHVAGILAGNGSAATLLNSTRNVGGMAPKANLINLRVLDANGSGSDSAVIKAIARAIELRDTFNIRVINLSVGRPVYESYTNDPLCQAVEKAWQAGIVVVVAAGNQGRNNSTGTQGYATITSPANDPFVITVGAMKTNATVSRADDQIASYSSKGPTLIDHIVKPDLVAPGNRVISLASMSGTIFNSSNVNKVPSSYFKSTTAQSYSTDYVRLSGTSMAAPMVAGAAALMLQKEPGLNPDTVKARLMKTATKSFPQFSTAVDPVTNQSFTSQSDIFTVGAGYLDAWAAINCTDSVPSAGAAISPTAVYNPALGSISVVNSNVAIWGTTAVWGTAAVWGTTAVWGTAAVWGTSMFVDGTTAVWGTAAVWGTTAVWGSGFTSAETFNRLVNGEN